MPRQSPLFYIALSLSCAAVMALQILQSRIFSVVTWYHLSFLVISVAMFGLTLGALKIYRMDEGETRRNMPQLAARASFLFAISIMAALAVQVAIPIVHTNALTILVTLPLVAGATAMNYYYAGQVVTLCLTRTDRPIGLVYCADLLGAAMGCLAALFLMQAIDSPTATIFIAAIAMMCACLFEWQSAQPSIKNKILIASLLVVIASANLAASKPFIYTFWTKGAVLSQDRILHEEWNAISRVTVQPALSKISVFMWGPSPEWPSETQTEYRYLAIDGDASTPITKFDGHSWNELKYLEYDVTNIAYFLPNLKSAVIIGVGGGRDLLSARYFGVEKTVALDVNAIQVDLLTKNPEYMAYTNLANQPDTRIINSEARSWLSRSHETFDILQMSMIDTWASTGAGAFALSENSLYTTDALHIFMRNLNPGGVLTVSRWYTKDTPSDTGRLISMAVTALLENGSTNPAAHIYIVRSGRIATFILGRDPLTSTQLNALHQAAQKMKYQIIASPDTQPQDPLLQALYNAKSLDELLKIQKETDFDMSAPTDMRPFFFNQTHVTRPLHVFKKAFEASMSHAVTNGHAIATLNLYLIILLSIGMAVLLLVPPLKAGLDIVNRQFLHAGSAYFVLIGFGFMLVEITLMQIMSMFLGHPIYGLGIVLFSLILSTGIGSAISEALPIVSKKRLMIWLALIAGYTFILSHNIQQVMENFVEADFIPRVLICIGMIMPLGLLLGFGFPTGIRLVQLNSSRMTTWFWAVNGAAGVVASALAILISIGWGLDKTLMLAGILYALLFIPAQNLLSKIRSAA